MNCVFCDIITHKMPADIVFENERVIIFKDYRPQAKIHLLICPKRHYDTLMDTPVDEIAYLFKVCRVLADKLKVHKGFRLMINNGPQGGQIIFHLHVHFMVWMKQLDTDQIDLDIED